MEDLARILAEQVRALEAELTKIKATRPHDADWQEPQEPTGNQQARDRLTVIQASTRLMLGQQSTLQTTDEAELAAAVMRLGQDHRLSRHLAKVREFVALNQRP